MHFKVFLLFGALVMWERAQSAPCNCGLGTGVNVCSGSDCSPLVVRPQQLPVIDLCAISQPRIVCKQVGGELAPLKPVGGLCSCGQTIIKPAVVPRPSCACCNTGGCSSSSSSSGISGSCGSCGSSSSSSSGSCSQGCQSSSSDQVISQGGGGGSITVQFPACGPPVFNRPRQLPQAPADVVSQDLAYRQRQQQRNDKAELRLAYGFQRIPQETPCCKKSTTFREGNIQLINGQVLELPNYAPQEEEEDEQEYIEEEPEIEVVDVQPPSFEDLGFRLANYDSGKFINIDTDEEATCNSGLGDAPVCNDGYRAGEVVIKEGQVNPLGPQGPLSPSCDDDGETPCQSNSFYEVPSYSSSYCASSSSSSNSAQSQSQVFLQKLSCSK